MKKLLVLGIVAALAMIAAPAGAVLLDDLNTGAGALATGWNEWDINEGVTPAWVSGGPSHDAAGSYQQITYASGANQNKGGVTKFFSGVTNQTYKLGASVTGALSSNGWFELHHQDGDVTGDTGATGVLDTDGDGWVKYDTFGLGAGPGGSWASHGTTGWTGAATYTVQQGGTPEGDLTVTAGGFTVWAKCGGNVANVMGFDYLETDVATNVGDWMLY